MNHPTKLRLLRLLAVVVLLAVAGCTPDHGTVTRTRWSYVCVRDTAGNVDCHKVRHDVAVRCRPGDRWPDCQETRTPTDRERTTR